LTFDKSLLLRVLGILEAVLFVKGIYAQYGEGPYYLAHIRSKLVERYGGEIIEQGGLDITAAMDLNLQRLAERVLREGIGRISPQIQGALFPWTLLPGCFTVAGGTDFKRYPYNRAFFAKRQPGSAIRPLIYAAALEKGLPPAAFGMTTRSPTPETSVKPSEARFGCIRPDRSYNGRPSHSWLSEKTGGLLRHGDPADRLLPGPRRTRPCARIIGT
jgi:membrane peptidoglycan carboxypeptidase